MAMIQSGADATLLTVDPVSKAARVTLYDASGNPLTTLTTTAAPMAAASSSPTGVVSLGNNLGKVTVAKTGSLVTTTVAAGQVVQTYTVTAGKTFYLMYLSLFARLTTMAATATNFGTASLENPAASAMITDNLAGGAGASQEPIYAFEEPIPIPAGTVIRVTVTPSATTSFTWNCSFGGYEK